MAPVVVSVLTIHFSFTFFIVFCNIFAIFSFISSSRFKGQENSWEGPLHEPMPLWQVCKERQQQSAQGDKIWIKQQGIMLKWLLTLGHWPTNTYTMALIYIKLLHLWQMHGLITCDKSPRYVQCHYCQFIKHWWMHRPNNMANIASNVY